MNERILFWCLHLKSVNATLRVPRDEDVPQSKELDELVLRYITSGEGGRNRADYDILNKAHLHIKDLEIVIVWERAKPLYSHYNSLYPSTPRSTTDPNRVRGGDFNEEKV